MFSTQEIQKMQLKLTERRQNTTSRIAEIETDRSVILEKFIETGTLDESRLNLLAGELAALREILSEKYGTTENRDI